MARRRKAERAKRALRDLQDSSATKRKRAQRVLRRRASWCMVYAICDLDGVPKYVGQTRCSIESRMNFHWGNAFKSGSPVHRWLRTQTRRTVKVTVLESNAVWDVDEILWIERLRQEGLTLLNATRGGNDFKREAA